MVSRTAAVAPAAVSDCAISGHVQNIHDLALDQRADLAVIPREGLQLASPKEGNKILAALARHIVPGGWVFVDPARFNHESSVCDPDCFRPGHPGGVTGTDWARELPGGNAAPLFGAKG